MLPFTDPETLSALLLSASLIGIISFKLARTLAVEKILLEPRQWLQVKLTQKKPRGIRETGLRAKLAYMLGCPICLGFWISLAVTCVALGVWPLALSLTGLFLWMCSWGIQTIVQRLCG